MKLVHQISLMLLAAVLIAIVAMGALMAVNLQRGFVDYLNQRQLTQLDDLVARVTAEAERRGSLEHLRGDQRAWDGLVTDSRQATLGGAGASAAKRERGYGQARPPRPRGAEDAGNFDDRPPPPPGRDDDRPPPGDRRDGPPDRPANAPPGKGDPLGLGPRFHLYDERHVQMNNERRPPPDSGTPIEREIKVGGRTVGFVVHTPVFREPTVQDAAFLRKQFKDIGLAALGLIVVALLAAPFVARRWTRPIQAIGEATARIAKGEFDVRLDDNRADEIGGLMKNVNAMAISLQEMEQARKRWIAESAHELRTPLAVLRGEIEALQDGVRQFDAKSLASLGDEARHLTKLVNDLHLLSLADMGALPCTMTAFDLVALVRRMAVRYAARAGQHGLTLEAKLPGAAMEVLADEDRIEQLLTNLLENSLRYTDAPGRIELKVSREGNTVHITIEDSAPGVSAADCNRLFEPLFRADAARSRAAGGSGLGLAICRAIVKAHGGKIAARPSPMGGLAITAVLALSGEVVA